MTDSRFVVDKEATERFHKVAAQTRELAKRRDGSLSACLAIHFFGADISTIEELGWPLDWMAVD